MLFRYEQAGHANFGEFGPELFRASGLGVPLCAYELDRAFTLEKVADCFLKCSVVFGVVLFFILDVLIFVVLYVLVLLFMI